MSSLDTGSMPPRHDRAGRCRSFELEVAVLDKPALLGLGGFIMFDDGSGPLFPFRFS